MRIFTQISLLLIFALTLNSCLKSTKETLPPITIEGKNVLACYINGELFISKGKSRTGFTIGYNNGNRASYYEPFKRVRISSREQNPLYASIGITFIIEEGKFVYELNQIGNSSASVTLGIEDSIHSEPEHRTNAQYKGHVELLQFRHGKPDGINFIAGTFAFDAINAEGDVIEVREGRFDISF